MFVKILCYNKGRRRIQFFTKIFHLLLKFYIIRQGFKSVFKTCSSKSELPDSAFFFFEIIYWRSGLKMNIRISCLNAETELWIHFRRMKNIFQVRKDFQRLVQYSTLENKGVAIEIYHCILKIIAQHFGFGSYNAQWSLSSNGTPE